MDKGEKRGKSRCPSLTELTNQPADMGRAKVIEFNSRCKGMSSHAMHHAVYVEDLFTNSNKKLIKR